jgi:uncharacterized caspase-like protein
LAERQSGSSLEGGEESLVFYAGHGLQLGSANYLLPVDIKGDSEEQVKDEGIELQRVLDDLKDRKVKFALAIIDACRDNPFKTAGRTIGGRGLSATAAATAAAPLSAARSGALSRQYLYFCTFVLESQPAAAAARAPQRSRPHALTR